MSSLDFRSTRSLDQTCHTISARLDSEGGGKRRARDQTTRHSRAEGNATGWGRPSTMMLSDVAPRDKFERAGVLGVSIKIDRVFLHVFITQ